MTGMDFLGYALGSFVWLIIAIIIIGLIIIAIVTIGMIISGIIEWAAHKRQEKEFNDFLSMQRKISARILR